MKWMVGNLWTVQANHSLHSCQCSLLLAVYNDSSIVFFFIIIVSGSFIASVLIMHGSSKYVGICLGAWTGSVVYENIADKIITMHPDKKKMYS